MLTLLSTREHRLHITGDSSTRGIRSTITIMPKQDTQQWPLTSFVLRTQAVDKGFTSTELYTLLALASQKHLAQPLIKDTITYQVHLNRV